MNFHLQFPIAPFPEKLEYSHSSLFMGSCFAENIGGMLQRYKLKTLINPHGVLYNPTSITVALRRYIRAEAMSEEQLFEANGSWHSAEHHSRFSGETKAECLEGINAAVAQGHEALKKADWLFITYGTTLVYKDRASGLPVGNCHKLPQYLFEKERMSLTGIVEEQQQLFVELKKLNPQLRIVLTVSPVRYVREGVVENNLSKATLIAAVHELVKLNERVFCFPAYELLIDDLRDYRFYKPDLVHPNEQAIAYIFEKLVAALFSDEAVFLLSKMKEIIAAAEHRSFNPALAAHKKFMLEFFLRCKELRKLHPGLDLEEEMQRFSA